MADETVKDIAADLRARAARAEAAAGFPTVEAENDRRLAGRIEAAAERDAGIRAPGNAAAMREALEAIVAYWDWGGFTDTGETGLKYMARAALAAPARNCDRFANWMRAWDGYLAEYPDARQEMPFEIGRFHHWLFAKTEGGAS